jgi:hypothetical protein
LIEYKIVVIYMFDEQASHDTIKVGLELFCDVEMFLGLNILSPCWNLSEACSSLLRIGTFLYVILLLLSKNVRCNCIKCTMISRPCMGRWSLGSFWTWCNIQMMFYITLGFLTRTLSLNMHPFNSMNVFICNIKGAQS